MQQVLPSAMRNAIFLFISRQNIFCLKDMYIYVCVIYVCMSYICMHICVYPVL